MNKDTGSWLSAEQAVLPDGTEVGNLPLVNKKLPILSQSPVGDVRPSKSQVEQFNAAINFALDKAGIDGLVFLGLWREGAWEEISKEFPEFKGPLPN